jgi:hypothetical protein
MRANEAAKCANDAEMADETKAYQNGLKLARRTESKVISKIILAHGLSVCQ